MASKPMPKKPKNIKKRCAVPQCFANDLEARSFHNFPRDEQLKEQWIKNINDPSFVYKQSQLICCAHFTRDCFETIPGYFIPGHSLTQTRTKLRKDAAPTIFTNKSLEPPKPCVSVTRELDLPSTSTEDNPAKIKKRQTEGNTNRNQYVQSIPPKLLGFAKDASMQTILKLRKNTECQTEIMGKDVACQTDFKSTHEYEPEELDISDSQEVKRFLEEEEDEGATLNPFDVSYTPSELPQEDIKEARSFNLDNKTAMKERKFIVFESALLQLFSFCFQCLLPCKITTSTWGSMVTVTAECERGHTNVWKSQPLLGQKPFGNILIAASILFAGLNPTQALRMLSFSGIQAISRTTFFRIQKCYLLQCIRTVWHEEQIAIFKSLKKKKLKLGGDARSDSPGFSAKYGTYVFFESQIKKIIHLVLVQSTEVKNSVAMELEGLKRGITFLMDAGLKIASIVTDRHVQIRSYLKKSHPKIKHFFDCWHMVKSLKKKIHAAATKEYAVLDEWNKSIQNHMYWCATSSKGKAKLIQAKFMSVLRHVANIHQGHGKLFPKCTHGNLSLDGKKRQWLIPGTTVFEKLKKIICLFEKDILQISPETQTSSVEAFNSVMIHFAPKNTHYSYLGMEARMLLAALHFNENSNKIQATTKDGNLRWNIYFPKAKKGEYSVKPIMLASTFGYIEKLMAKLVINCEESYEQALIVTEGSQPTIPKPLSTQFEHPEKEEAIEAYQSKRRFLN